MNYLLVALGAGLGAMGRYQWTAWVKKWRHFKLPMATLSINWLGSFLLAFCVGFNLGPNWYHLLGIGVLGGFTTFSTLNSELAGLLFQRRFKTAFIYFIATYVGGLCLALIGYFLGHKLL